EPFGGGDEVIETMLLLREPAAVVPGLPEFATATDGSHSVNTAKPYPRGSPFAVARPQGDAETAVSVEQSTVGAIEHDIGPMNQCHRHVRAGGARDKDLPYEGVG